MMGWLIFVIPIGMLFALGGLVEWRRKKRNNYPHIPTNSNIRPGESQDFRMGASDKDVGSGF